MKRKGFTLIELLVVIAIIAMLLAILMPALSKVKKIAQRVVCGTNLKGLGTAQTVYANDYEDRYAQQYYQGHQIEFYDTTGWQNPNKDFRTQTGPLSIGASLYLLVREADVSPKSFVCPSGAETIYDGKNLPNNYDITELWDFGHSGILPGTGPANCLSYSYQNPYCRYAADGSRGAAFAMMGDRNPWHDPKLTYIDHASNNVTAQNMPDHVSWLLNDWVDPPPQAVAKYDIQVTNAQPHGREGQNVVFGDGHSSFEKRPDVGVNHDNIYTPAGGSGPVQVRRGNNPAIDKTTTGREIPYGQNDSYLVNDSRRAG